MEIKTTNETTHNFFEAQEGEVLNGLGKFSYDILCKEYDGIFKNSASWTKFLKRVDNCELTKWLEYKTKNSYVKKIDYATIEYYDKDGINISTGFIIDTNGEKIYTYDKYNTIIIEIDWEFYYSATSEKPTMIEIFGKICDLKKDK